MSSNGTVSPKDVFGDREAPFAEFSAPNSNAMTNLTTPELFSDTSPHSGYETSPLFDAHDSFGSAEYSTFPLFDNHDYEPAKQTGLHSSMTSFETAAASTDMERTVSSSSLGSNSGNSNHKRKSGDLLRQTSEASHVTKASRRSVKELIDIEVDESDPVAAKRQKNTLAARKSRQKKRDIEDELRKTIDHLKEEVDHWKCQAIAHGAPIPKSKRTA